MMSSSSRASCCQGEGQRERGWMRGEGWRLGLVCRSRSLSNGPCRRPSALNPSGLITAVQPLLHRDKTALHKLPPPPTHYTFLSHSLSVFLSLSLSPHAPLGVFL